MPDGIIYLGPSLPRTEAEKILLSGSVEFRPPVKRGDLAGAVAAAPRIICIIDGLFFENAAVGHREILSALREGIRVIGASSMGALRAAELESFGMEGIGEVYRRYRDHEIESDDEVALICDPETGTAFSEALVNIRITLEKAVLDGPLLQNEAESLLQAARSLYYPERTFEQAISSSRIAPDRQMAFRLWLAENRVDQKEEDARLALRYVRKILAFPGVRDDQEER